MVDLCQASSQWASRPPDQRFWALRDLRAACTAAQSGSLVKRLPMGDLRVQCLDDDLELVGPAGNPARFTHYAFGQLATAVGAPAGYLRELPAAVAARCLNAGLAKESSPKGPRDLLFHKNGGLTLRACLSDKYERVWDAEVCAALEGLGGWRAPAGRTPSIRGIESRPATIEDILPGQINIAPGDMISPSGLYASDHDMFAFLVAPDRVISDGAGGALMRGVFVRNSEVGDASLSVTFFLMQTVCGNHIVWSASNVHEVRVRHVGRDPLHRALRGLSVELRRYHDAAPEEERRIIAARKLTLGTSKEEVLDAIIKYAKTHSLNLSRKRVDEAYEIADRHQDWYGSPRTLWGVVAGLTQGSQAIGYADDRTAVDMAAGRLLEMAKE